MDTAIEDSNLAYIGSDEDKAAREAAANLEVDWEGCGEAPGVEIWRVENVRTESGAPDFGINKWPEAHYGEFFQGDSYIVLKTTLVEDALLRDIFFWIGSESSQDEYGVAAYKANELDDLFGDAPVQHRELEGYESALFMDCFPTGGIKYLKGGVDSGFRAVDADAATVVIPTRLFQVRKCQGEKPKSYLVPLSSSSLNQGDAFVLDANSTVYTWYGDECSPFEKNKAIDIATSLVDSRTGQATLVQDVDDSVEAFWEALGGQGGDIAAADAVSDHVLPKEHASKMYKLSEDDSQLSVTQMEEPSESLLDTTAVCMMDIGTEILVWIGSGANKREQSQAMSVVGTYLKNFDRQHNTKVTRVLEGQEGRCASWSKAFA